MRIALTGTPGTGKTTAAEELTLDRQIVHLNELVTAGGRAAGWDEERDSAIADLPALREWLADQPTSLLVESHLSHLLPVGHVIVLRCDPAELDRRLRRRYGDDAADGQGKVTENVESERLDLIYVEALEQHGEANVTAIDTTDQEPAETAKGIEGAIETAETGSQSAPQEPHSE